MYRKLFLFLGLIGIVIVMLRTPSIKGVETTIFIHEDGRIDPSNAPISTSDNVTYTFTENTSSAVVIEKNNIVLDGEGFRIQGSGAFESKGIVTSGISNVTIRNLSIDNFTYGLWMNYTANATISDNKLTSCYHGISFTGNYTLHASYYPSYSLFSGNKIANCTRDGMWFLGLWNSTIAGNQIATQGSDDGIYFDACAGNTVTVNNITECGNAGFEIHYDYVSGAAAGGNRIEANHLENNGQGIVISQSDSNIVVGNDVKANDTVGVTLSRGSFNVVNGNNITANRFIGIAISSFNSTVNGNNVLGNANGVTVSDCSDNRIFQNNFVNNSVQTGMYSAGSNFWDNGLEGNYWSDYVGIDPNRDGIGDTTYVIDSENVDNFPLMGAFSAFSTSMGYFVEVVSNTTIADFRYYSSNNSIVIHVSNMSASQTIGFCRVAVPHALMNQTYHATIDGVAPTYLNYSIYDNGTVTWVYFAFHVSIHEIVIVPEFLPVMMLPLLVAITLLSVSIRRSRTDSSESL